MYHSALHTHSESLLLFLGKNTLFRVLNSTNSAKFFFLWDTRFSLEPHGVAEAQIQNSLRSPRSTTFARVRNKCMLKHCALSPVQDPKFIPHRIPHPTREQLPSKTHRDPEKRCKYTDSRSLVCEAPDLGIKIRMLSAAPVHKFDLENFIHQKAVLVSFKIHVC